MLNLEWLYNNKENILFECVYGSYAYGTNIETSDKDIRGVYIMPQSDLYGLEYTPQISDDKNDVVYYEIGRFCELLLTSNTTVLEMLNIPIDCITINTDIFDKLFKSKSNDFVNKDLIRSMIKMCKSQINKASGLNKKMNIKKDELTRKLVIDFCYVPFNQGSISLNDYLLNNNIKSIDCGLVKVPNMRDGYFLFHSNIFNYKGICKDDSNDVCLSSIPKGEVPLTFIQFNKDSYTTHCKEYREYLDWLKNRNTQRYVDVENHNQQIDGKNMMHCIRVIETLEEVIKTGIFKVRRENRDYLLSIRHGKLSLVDIKTKAIELISNIESILENINLSESNDISNINSLLINLRKEFYAKL